MSVEWLLPAIVLVPLGGAPLLLCLRLPDRAAAWFGVAAGTVTLLLGGWATFVAWDRGLGRMQLEVRTEWVPALGVQVHLGADGVSAPLILLTALLAVLVCAHLVRVRPEHGQVRLLVVCVLAVTGGALATFTAMDLLLFFIAFETVLIPMWFVIGVWGDTRAGGEAARRDAASRFVLYTATGSALMLLGIVLVIVRAGTSDLTELIARGGAGLSATTQTVAAVLIVLGLAVKTPIWPLHTWLPPAHTIAPTAGSVLLAGVLLKLGTYGLVRVAVPVLPAGTANVAPWLGGFAVVGIVWAGLACLAERDLKRLVALSSVAHMGFVLLGVASMTSTGLQGALYANIAHGVVSALLFFVVGALKDRHHSADLAVLGPGLRDRLPRLGRLLTLGAVAGLGLPGLAVFWGELLAIAGAWQSATLGPLGRPFAVLAAIGTAIAAAYWLRVLRLLWQGTPAPGPHTMGDATRHESAVTLPLVVTTVALGLVPGPLLAATAGVVRLILPGGGVMP
ncbi:NADH-quinone oxidoreductase subunit M [Kineosporia sp. J2-2]|uniref:NADH-quinone oxidoreductase subunit M n=1 Tax=Kineosporia corallincola TaxID=2835133 RepID=A0ABS5T9T6_9ACTN|nr:NADH-quinone oxidoreductase subunit M [Kineosporia corallincola]MBT0767805.1 NADH-quinone oxidoreductase subunit M [Kineosporia corallincola]